MAEILLSLRVNALQIQPEQRRNFVQTLIKIDIFNIEPTKSLDFLMRMLSLNSHELKHALSSLISVIVSTKEGVNYMVST